MKRHLVVLLLVCLLGLVGCGTNVGSFGKATPSPSVSVKRTPSVTATPPAVLPTTVRVTRSGAWLGITFAPFDRTVTDAMKVQRLYQVILSLPRFAEPSLCPISDEGLSYRLTFSRNHVSVSVVWAGGCGYQDLEVEGENHQRWSKDPFWVQLAATLGIPKADLFVSPLNCNTNGNC